MIATLAAAAVMAATAAHAAGNPAAGKDVFARCAICHSSTKGAPARIGPNLWGVSGRRAATQPDFSYSSALKSSGITWTDANLDKWITSPGQMVPGNRMAFAGISSAQQRADLIAYLDTLK